MSEKIYIELYNEDTDESVEVGVECEVFVEPTEYVGGYVFYQGGVTLDGHEFDAFTFNGVDYPASANFPKELEKFVVGVDEKHDLDDVIEKEFESATKDYSVPKKHYGKCW